MAHAQPAMRFGNEHAGQAHLGELRPQVARKAGGVGTVAQAAQMRNRGLFGHEGRDAVLEHRLVVIVIQGHGSGRSEEHTSELQSLMRISYAVFCLKKNNSREIKKKSLPRI